MNDAGRIGFVLKGDYDPNVQYEFLDVVQFGNAAYAAKKNTVGNQPEDGSEFWQLIAKSVDIQRVNALPETDIDASVIYAVMDETENKAALFQYDQSKNAWVQYGGTGDADFIEITYDEYEALLDADKADGKARFIYNVPNTGQVIMLNNKKYSGTTFTGTTAEFEAAVAAGKIEEDMIVNITDDSPDGNIAMISEITYEEFMLLSEEEKRSKAYIVTGCPEDLTVADLQALLGNTDISNIGNGTVTSAVSILNSKINSMQTDAASAHNNIYRRQNITDMYDSGKYSENVANNTFADIYPGDFIQKTITYNGTSYPIMATVADLNYFRAYPSGYATITEPHSAMIIEGLPAIRMNETNTTEGGYSGSEMNTVALPAILESLKAAFGEEHIITHKKLLSNAVGTSLYNRFGSATGASSDFGWYDSAISLMSEVQVLGATVWSSSGYDTGEANRQLAVFHLKSPNALFGWTSFWLRDVVSNSLFSRATSDGGVSFEYASNVSGVYPLILLK